MKKCANCGEEFPSLTKDKDGKRIDSRRRKYCLVCNPPGERRFWKGKLTNKSLGIARGAKTEKKCKTCNRKFKNATRNLECSTCQNKQIRHERKKKAHAILGGKCKVCGYDRCSSAMDIHHIDKNIKKFTLASSWGLAWDTIMAELDKCVLLCCRCHREVHDGVIDLE